MTLAMRDKMNIEKGREEIVCDLLRKMMKNLRISAIQAMDILEIPANERQKYQDGLV